MASQLFQDLNAASGVVSFMPEAFARSWNADKGKRATYPGTQFPIDAYEQFMKQGVPRWVTTDKQIVAAYIEQHPGAAPTVPRTFVRCRVI